MSEFRRGFGLVAEQFVGDEIGRSVSRYADRVEASVEELIRDMAKVAVNDKDLHFAKGDVAELWHAGALNLDATQRGIPVAAFAPRDASPIDVALRGVADGQAAQLKFYGMADATAKAISDPKYGGLDQKVVPSDQLEGVREAARRLALGNPERPEVAESYAHTSRVVDDRLRIDGAESRPLTERESRELTEQLRQSGDIDRDGFGLTPQQVVRWEDILRESTAAGARAALIAAALQAAPYLVTIAKKGIESGELSARDFAPLGRAMPKAMLRSGLAGGITAAFVGAAKQELLGATLKSVDPTFISAAVVLSICTIENSFKVATGEMSAIEASVRTAEDAFSLAVAMGFGAIGSALIPVPVLGTLVGSIVGALVARLVVDGANEAVVSVAATTGWTFFGLVDQNYSVPAELLAASGWRTVELKTLEPRQLQVDSLNARTFEPAAFDLRVLRRGVVSFRRVGYLS